MTTAQPQRILLVGAGRFGRHHLDEWKKLADEGEATIAGVVVKSPESQRAIAEEYGLPVHTKLEDHLLEQVDGVDIVTPPDTHFELVGRCLQHAHVLVEKPLATTGEEAAALQQQAQEADRVLMVAHIYRFHPVIQQLKRIVSEIPELPRTVVGSTLNPLDDDVGRSDANLEFLHLFDVIDFLFGGNPDICVGTKKGNVHHVSLQYPGPMNAVLAIGWQGRERVRTFNLIYSDREIKSDLIDNTIVIAHRDHQLDKMFFGHRPVALAAELRAFLDVMRDRSVPHPDAAIGARILDIAVRCAPRPPAEKPRVAIMGGGIFGATFAIELGKFCDVTLFERHGGLMTEVSYLNQWRHHSGFHYPRSYDQIQEIKATRGEFEAEYGDAVIKAFASYFCTSNTGVEIPAARYLAACRSNELNFTMESPPAEVLDRSKVSLCVKSDEGMYDYALLRDMAQGRLRDNENISTRLHTEVLHGVIDRDGTKRLIVRDPQGTHEETFDYLVNATYANRNLLAKWFRFPIEPLIFATVELLVVRLPIPPICVTILDGPFTSLLGMGMDNLFMLSRIDDSVLRSVITEDGLPPRWGPVQSNRENMLRHSRRYLPILDQAEVVESRYATRAVNAYAKDFDARPTIVTNHGFGCWSILGGKIITCVTNSREIASEIRAEREHLAPRAPQPS